MTEIQTYTNAAFGSVRVLYEDGKPLFCGADACKALGYRNHRKAMNDHCRGVTKRYLTDNLGRRQEANFLPEGDLYRLITHSKLPGAEKFERWVFDEVLPALRKNGGYIAGQENMTDAEIMAKALLVAQRTIESKQAAIEEMTPKAVFADAVSASKSSILVGELAKMLRQNGVDMGEKRLFDWLRNNGYLVRRNGSDRNMPTQRSVDQGLFTIKETSITHSDGHIIISKTAKVTGKGQVYFINKFLKAQEIA